MRAEFIELLKDVKFCFCLLCKHQSDFGHCYFCHCHNHVPQPELTGEAIRLKEAFDYTLNFAREIAQEHEKAGKP